MALSLKGKLVPFGRQAQVPCWSNQANDRQAPGSSRSAGKESVLKIAVDRQTPNQSVTIVRLGGRLDGSNYLDLVAKAQEIREVGGRHLILDMSNVSSMGISGLLALHTVAALLGNEEPLNPAGGWKTLRTVCQELKAKGLQDHVKLCNPQDRVTRNLEEIGVRDSIEIYPDVPSAVSSFERN